MIDLILHGKPKTLIMAIKKQYLKSKPVCKVTFTVPTEDANEVVVAGSFNDWNEKEFQLKKLKNGSFKGTIDLEVPKKYEFRYIIDGVWTNDAEADGQVANSLNSENSILDL